MMRLSFRLGAGAVIVLGAACGGSDPTSDVPPGSIEVVLQEGATNLGGMMLEISGGVVDSVTAAGYTTYSARYSGTATRVLVAGTVVPGLLAYAYLHDGQDPAAFTVTPLSAADATSFALLDVSGIHFKLLR
jgi:hypothetical protein